MSVWRCPRIEATWIDWPVEGIGPVLPEHLPDVLELGELGLAKTDMTNGKGYWSLGQLSMTVKRRIIVCHC